MQKDLQHLNTCKAGQTLVGPFDLWLKNFLIPFIPAWVHPNHLTMASLLWIVCTCLAPYLAISYGNMARLWLVVFALFGHYITDLLDGELGRVRKTGYILWGFYMDHFFDYIFLSAIIGSVYFVVLPVVQGPFIVLGLLLTIMFVHLYISMAVKDILLIVFHGIGPTEFRFIGVALILLVIYTPMLLLYVILIMIVVVLVALIVAIYTTQKILGKKDMENKRGLV